MVRSGVLLAALFSVLSIACVRADVTSALIAPGGVPDFGTAVDSPTIKIDNKITLEAWVHPTAWRSYTGREKHGLNFMFKGRIGTHIDYMFCLQANGYLCYGSTYGTVGILRPVVPLNQWTHVAVTVNESAGDIHFYVNGVDQGAWGLWGGSFDAYNSLRPSSYSLYVGGFYQWGWPYNNDNFIGKMGEVRIWNKVRTASEIQADYQKKLNGNEPGLAAYWDMQSTADKTSHGNNMTLTGAAVLQSGAGPDLQGNNGINVAITSPTNNQIFARGANVTITATATSTNGVSNVRFYNGATLLGIATGSPYRVVWSNIPSGAHAIYARATNAIGGQGASAEVTIRVPGPYTGTPYAIPGTVEMENFDTGGAGVAYNDLSPANEGGAYRLSEQVDISAVAGAGNGHEVSYGKASEWLQYTVNVLSNATYTLKMRAAIPGSGAQFRVEVDGVDKSGNVTIPNTGSWSAYQDVVKTGINLVSGVHVIRVVLVADASNGWAGNFDRMVFEYGSGGSTSQPPVVVNGQSAYPSGTPAPVPGTIQCENFDNGGSGVAYSDTTPANESGAYRSGVQVSIAAQSGTGNGHVVDYTKAGEWLEYTVLVASNGSYTLAMRVASPQSGSQFRMEVDGVDKTGTIAIPNTGSWGNFQNVEKTGVNLSSGIHTVRLAMVASGPSSFVGNFDWFSLVSAGGIVITSSPPVITNLTAYPSGIPAPLPGTVEIENFDKGGQGAAYNDTTAANESGAYRPSERVSIATFSGAGNNHVVDFTKAGEWLNFTVIVTTNGSYGAKLRVSNPGAGAQVRIEVDGADKTGTMVIPNTGGWGTFQTIEKTGLALSTGIHTVRLYMVSTAGNGWVGNFDSIQWTLGTNAAPTSAPVVVTSAYPAGVAPTLPGTIQAENFDLGGPGAAYADNTVPNHGGAYRLSEQVDIAKNTGAGNNHTVEYAQSGEWLKYTVNVTTSGLYTAGLRISNPSAGAKFRIEVDGADKTGDVNVPNTGSWGAYQTIQPPAFAMASGIHTVRLYMAANGANGWFGNVDWLSFSYSGAAPGRPESLVRGSELIGVVTSDEASAPGAGWNAFDGDEKTIWEGLPNAAGWWMALTFDPAHTLHALDFSWLAEPAANLEFLSSVDAISWTSLALPLTNGPVSLNYLWIVFPDANGGTPPAIREVILK